MEGVLFGWRMGVMSMNENIRKYEHQRARIFLGLAVAWTIVVAGSLILNIWQVRRNTVDAARIQARIAHEKDVLYRRWNAGHGGVYVPVTEETLPNPYLSELPERDISTSSDQQLTLMNPAYMTRQVHELQLDVVGLRGHITSLNPVRPQNAADEWETEALQAFERGELEISSVEMLEGQEYMRLMRPLVTEEGCLKCHATQGYQEGDIRGGISVSVPMAPLWEIERGQMLALWAGHIPLWLLGLGGIYWVGRRLVRGEQSRQKAELALVESEASFRAVVEDQTEFISRWKTDGTLTFVNQRYADLFGKSPEELINTSFFPLISKESLAKIKQRIKNLSPEQPTFTEEYHSRDGRCYQWTERGVFDEEGKLIEVQSVGRDVTEQKTAQEALKQSELRAQLLKDIIIAANTADSSEQILELALEKVAQYTGWPVGHVYEPAADGTGDMAPANIWYLENPGECKAFQAVTAATRFAPGVGLPGRSFSSKQATWIENICIDPNFFRAQQARELGLHGAFGFPVIVDGEVVAVLEFFSAEPKMYDELLLDLVDQIGTQIGSVVKRRLLDEVLAQSEEKYRAIVQDQADFLVRFLPDTTRVFANERYVEYSGKSLSDLIGKKIADEVPESDRPRLMGKIAALTPDAPTSVDEYPKTLPDGEVRWESWTERGIFDEHGQLLEIQSTGRDITLRKLAEQEVLLQNAALEAAHNAIVISDINGTIIWVNRAFTRLTGYSRE